MNEFQDGSMLQEVEVKAKSEPVPFFKDRKYSVLDFEVDSGFVFLLVYRFRLVKSELICKSVSGDTVARSGFLTCKPTGLFRDCLGNIHVLSADSAYQVNRRHDHLELFFPVEINRFRSILSDCVASTDTLLFFRKDTPDHLRVEFFTVDRQTGRKRFLGAALDEARLKMLQRNPQDYCLLTMDTIPSDRNMAISMQWMKKFLYPPNTSSLYKIGDQLCVFNTTDYTLGLYTSTGDFTSKRKMPVEEIDGGRWTSGIFIDDPQCKAYTVFRSGGKFTLYRIDLNTGELKRQFDLTHNFPQKIRIHKNLLFYLYDVPGEGDNRQLFRQKL